MLVAHLLTCRNAGRSTAVVLGRSHGRTVNRNTLHPCRALSSFYGITQRTLRTLRRRACVRPRPSVGRSLAGAGSRSGAGTKAETSWPLARRSTCHTAGARRGAGPGARVTSAQTTPRAKIRLQGPTTGRAPRGRAQHFRGRAAGEGVPALSRQRCRPRSLRRAGMPRHRCRP